MQSSGIGIVILAGGASSRLGKPKQLLEYKGKSLLTHAIDLATATGANQVITVLGAHADQLISESGKTGTTVLKNTEWEDGMASSIRVGLTGLLEIDPDVEAVILMVCDQPFVNGALLNELMNEYRSSGKPIIACAYGDSIGTPALFDKTIFASLLQLEGDAGAKKIIKSSPQLVQTISFPEGNIDIDTIADYNNLVALAGERTAI
jgi:molybdenum cofactor cytidylyltransferase